MTTEEHIVYWHQQALDDWETMQVLLQNRRYVPALFWLHLTIEKLCKAIWVQDNAGAVPPRIHNLVKLLAGTKLNVPDETAILLTELNRFQLEGRYPDYVSGLHKAINAQIAQDYVERTEPVKQWLRQQLPSY